MYKHNRLRQRLEDLEVNSEKRARAGAQVGISDAVIQDTAVKLGDFLAEKVCPATPEEVLMKELWDAATPDERKTLARLMVKISQ